MQFPARRVTIVRLRLLTQRCSTTSVMQGFSAKLAQGMPPKLRTIVRRPTTVLLARASMNIRQTIPTTQTGEEMPQLGAPKGQVSTEPTQSVSYLNATSIKSTHYWCPESAFGETLAPIQCNKLPLQKTRLNVCYSHKPLLERTMRSSLIYGNCSSKSSVHTKGTRRLGSGLISI